MLRFLGYRNNYPDTGKKVDYAINNDFETYLIL